MDLVNSVPKTAAMECDRATPSAEMGRFNSRGNALKHGLTATTLLPAAFGPENLARHLQRLRDEWQPQTPTQEILVGELARHAAALERAELAETAILRSGARAAAILIPPHVDDEFASVETQDFLLTGAMSNDAIERLTRYRRSHEKAWYQALQRLREMIDSPRPKPQRPVKPPWSFTENQCRAYLQERFQTSNWRCPHCGHTRGYWLATRRRWQCAGCARQLGLRSGTVMERSSLALSVWFAAIWAMLQNPNGTLAELASVTGIHREATLRHVGKRIREVIKTSKKTDQLAGLDQVLCEVENSAEK